MPITCDWKWNLQRVAIIVKLYSMLNFIFSRQFPENLPFCKKKKDFFDQLTNQSTDWRIKGMTNVQKNGCMHAPQRWFNVHLINLFMSFLRSLLRRVEAMAAEEQNGDLQDVENGEVSILWHVHERKWKTCWQ